MFEVDAKGRKEKHSILSRILFSILYSLMIHSNVFADCSYRIPFIFYFLYSLIGISVEFAEIRYEVYS